MDLKKIRRAVRKGRYEFTSHALEEMDEDDILESDVRRAIMMGKLVATLTDDPRGARFVVRGRTRIGEVPIEIVCRFLATGRLRIITVYVLEQD